MLHTAKSPRIAHSTMSHFFAALHFVKHTIKLFGINSKYVIITPNTKCPGKIGEKDGDPNKHNPRQAPVPSFGCASHTRSR